LAHRRARQRPFSLVGYSYFLLRQRHHELLVALSGRTGHQIGFYNIDIIIFSGYLGILKYIPHNQHRLGSLFALRPSNPARF